MYRAKAAVMSPTGLHAGPARQFVQAARKYPCQVGILARGREYDAKSMIGILGAGVNHGDTIEIICRGESEEEACKALVRLVQTDMDSLQMQEIRDSFHKRRKNNVSIDD